MAWINLSFTRNLTFTKWLKLCPKFQCIQNIVQYSGHYHVSGLQENTCDTKYCANTDPASIHNYCAFKNKPIPKLRNKIDMTLQFSSVAHSCLTLCDPMAWDMRGLPVHHQLLEFTQTHVHRVGDAIQPSHPLSSPSPPALNLSQHDFLWRYIIKKDESH